MMKNSTEKVWYACYGSNLFEDRFLCYIRGGKPHGAETIYKGCEDKTLPLDNEDFYISSELYFSKTSKNWGNGGVAFIKTNFESAASTMGRIWLITKGQLTDIARQENSTKGDLSLDLEKAMEEGFNIFKPLPSWYGNLMYLGNKGEYPIFTLTNEQNLNVYTKPSEDYVRTIAKGIVETHNFDKATIVEYLITKQGIMGNYTIEELNFIIDLAV